MTSYCDISRVLKLTARHPSCHHCIHGNRGGQEKPEDEGRPLWHDSRRGKVVGDWGGQRRFCPARATCDSPGQRPGLNSPPHCKPGKGAIILAARKAIAPLQGFTVVLGPVPRAAPWAIIFQPFRLIEVEIARLRSSHRRAWRRVFRDRGSRLYKVVTCPAHRSLKNVVSSPIPRPGIRPNTWWNRRSSAVASIGGS